MQMMLNELTILCIDSLVLKETAWQCMKNVHHVNILLMLLGSWYSFLRWGVSGWHQSFEYHFSL